MKVGWFSTSTGDTHNIISSLEYLGTSEVNLLRYDQRWNEEVQRAVQSNPSIAEPLRAGGWKILGWPRERVAMDEQMIRMVEEWKPDVCIYTSAIEGLFVPLPETLRKINSMVPLIHFCHDAQDWPWHPVMQAYEDQKCFSLTLNIDGGHKWPGGSDWSGDFKINGMTALTPVDPRPYKMNPSIRVRDRYYPLGYAGNRGGPIRNYVVEQVGRALPYFVVRMREESPNSYLGYADFLRNCRIVINVPYTGSNASQHVKGRVVEAGYAGTCLLEWKNNATRQWFTPRNEYVEYTGGAIHESVQDCIEHAKFLVARPDMCEEIAMALQEKVLREHSPEAFWSRLFLAVDQSRAAEQAAEPSREAAE